MRRLVVLVLMVFAGVSVLSGVRWWTADSVTTPESQPRPAASPDSTHMPAQTDSRPEPAAGAQGSQSPAPPPADDPVPSARLEELALGLSMGFTREEARALANSLKPSILAEFFQQRSHIGPDWLHRQGLPKDTLVALYARWAAGATPRESESAPGDILLSRFSPRQDGGPYRVQDSFRAEDRSVFVHYTLPENYHRDSVVIRWTRKGEQSLNHFDYHKVSAGAGQRQEAWVRPRKGWEPGVYRVEVYGVDPSLPLIAQQDYKVRP